MKLGEDISKMYSPYKNDISQWKTSIISGQKFILDQRYEIIDVSIIYSYLVGRGASAIVVAAKDSKSIIDPNRFLAIKKIDKAFAHKLFAKSTLRELRILRLLKH